MAAINVPWKSIQGVIRDAIVGIGDNQPITIIRPGHRDGVPGEPWEGPSEPESHDIFNNIPALVVVETQKERDDTGVDVSVQSIKAIISIADMPITPQIGWTLTDDRVGTTYVIKEVKKVQPGVDGIIYVVKASR